MQRNDYREMVEKLSQDNADIISKMRGGKGHLVHMVLGIVGEAKEVSVEINKARNTNVELVKEAGDLLFYLTGAMEYGFKVHGEIPYVHGNNAEYGIDWVNELAEATKKYVMYADDSKWEAVFAALQAGMAYMVTLARDLGLDISDIAQANYEKLAKRFGDKLEYTDKAAIAKADRVSDGAVYMAASAELPDFSQAENLVKSDDYEDFGAGC